MEPKYDKIMYRHRVPIGSSYRDLHRYLVEVDQDFYDHNFCATDLKSQAPNWKNYCMMDGEVYPCVERISDPDGFPVCPTPFKFKHAPGGTVVRMLNTRLIWIFMKPTKVMSYILEHNLHICIEMLEGRLISITNNYIYVSKLVEEEKEMPPHINADGIQYPHFDASLSISTNSTISTISAKTVTLARTVPEIDRVIFNYPATIVFWKDGTKTVVKCGGNDLYDEETGLALCIAKKALGNKGNWYNEFKKWLPESLKFADEDVYSEIKKTIRRVKLKNKQADNLRDVVRAIEINKTINPKLPVLVMPEAAKTLEEVLKIILENQ